MKAAAGLEVAAAAGSSLFVLQLAAAVDHCSCCISCTATATSSSKLLLSMLEEATGFSR
jgi:hypothetical protein